MKKKILIVIGSMGRGGAERVISIISNYFAKCGWKVTIVLLLTNKVEYDLDKTIEVIDFTGGKGSRIKRLPFWISKIRKLVKNEKYDTILSFVARINVIVQIACMGLKQRIVVSERNDPYSDGRSKLVDIMTRFLYPKANAVVFQTKRAESYFEGTKLKNSCIIPNPISVEREACNAVHGKIVAVGRLAKQKNHKMLLTAFYGVVREHPEANLYVYGEGELKEDLERQAINLGISNKVFFEGNVQDVHSRISDAFMFVLPSDYEGLSNALLEAMMMGLPCISTECAGSDEYLLNETSGLLTPVGDYKALELAMLRYFEDEELRKSCGKEAKRLSNSFSSEVVLKKWYEILQG